MQKIIKTSAFFMVLSLMAFPLSVVETVSATGATCPLASTIVDFTPETVNAPSGAEQSLQDILTGASYTLDATNDQTQDQAWNVVGVSTITVNSKFITKATSNVVVFGYYTNDTMSNFVPVFKTDAVTGHSEFDSTPTAPGTFSLNIPGAPTSIGFAIKTFDATGASMGDFATENFLNNNFEDRAIVYNPASTPDTYVMAFDDSTVGDNDFNDMVVEVTLPCPGIPTNIPPVANAGNDLTITLPNNSADLFGFLSTDADGSIVSYHWSPVSGPTTVNPADGVMSTASPLVAGTYVFSLTVTDDKGATGSDDVQITVNPDPNTPPPILGGAGLTNQDGNTGGNTGNGNTDSNSNNNGSANLVVTALTEEKPTGQVLGAQTSCGIYASKYLKKNKKNDPEEVKKLQKFLNDHMKAGIKEDGVFGKNTDTFVRKFQAENKETVLAPWNLKKPTGIVYITTLAAINNAVCPELKLPIPKDLVPPSQNPLF